MMLLRSTRLPLRIRKGTHSDVPLPGCAPADASNPSKWTPFPHIEKRFDSIKVTSGVWVRAYRSGKSLRLASAGATGDLACSSDFGFDRAALRRPREDRVDDVSSPRCLIHWPAAPAWQSLPKLARPARAASENEDTHMTTD